MEAMGVTYRRLGSSLALRIDLPNHNRFCSVCLSVCHRSLALDSWCVLLDSLTLRLPGIRLLVLDSWSKVVRILLCVRGPHRLSHVQAVIVAAAGSVEGVQRSSSPEVQTPGHTEVPS